MDTRPRCQPMRRIRYLSVVVGVLLLCLPARGHSAAPVDKPYQRLFVHYVDHRSLPEKALNLIGLTAQDVGRSFALLAGVTRYPNMPEGRQELAPAAEDLRQLESYLRAQEFFDEIVVLQDGDVTLDNLAYFLQSYFPDRLQRFPKSRFVFAYSGHGMVEGPPGRPTGYLLKATATSLEDKTNAIPMRVLRVLIDHVVDAGHQVLVLVNACYSGAFLSRRPFGGTTVYLPATAARTPLRRAAQASGRGTIRTWAPAVSSLRSCWPASAARPIRGPSIRMAAGAMASSPWTR